MKLARNLVKAVKNPRKAVKRLSLILKERLFWEKYYSRVREPKIAGFVPHASKNIIDLITKSLSDNGFNVVPFRVDVEDYRTYLKKADYRNDYYSENFPEKSLEHYVAAKLLDLRDNDIYIDVANENSPTPGIYHKLYGCTVYRQDLAFPEGLHGNTIGGDAASMPLENEFASKLALHCSFEHFENDSDMNFVREAGRVLKRGGKLCIAPFYLFDRYVIQTDPTVLPGNGLPFEDDAVLYCAKGWRNRHGRFYDVPHLISRVRDNLGDLNLTIYVLQNEKEVDASCHLKLIGLFEKR